MYGGPFGTVILKYRMFLYQVLRLSFEILGDPRTLASLELYTYSETTHHTKSSQQNFLYEAGTLLCHSYIRFLELADSANGDDAANRKISRGFKIQNC